MHDLHRGVEPASLRRPDRAFRAGMGSAMEVSHARRDAAAGTSIRYQETMTMKRTGISSFLSLLTATLAFGCGTPGEVPEASEAPAAVQSVAQSLDLTTPPGGSGTIYLCCNAAVTFCYPAPNNHPWSCGPAPVIYACTSDGCRRQ
jgi:hypothetical protein